VLTADSRLLQVPEVREGVALDGAGSMIDMEHTVFVKQKGESAHDSMSTILHKYGTFYNTVFVLVYRLKDGGVWRLRRESVQRLARESTKMSQQAGMTNKLLRTNLGMAHLKAKSLLLKGQGAVGVRPTITEALEEAVEYLARQNDHYTVGNDGGVRVMAPLPGGQVMTRPTGQGGGGGGGGPNKKQRQRDPATPPGKNPRVVRLPGGTGGGSDKCRSAQCDPAQGGDPKRSCAFDHTHWGCAEPDPSVLKKAKDAVKLNLQNVIKKKK
jgi:hypothetical protein